MGIEAKKSAFDYFTTYLAAIIILLPFILIISWSLKSGGLQNYLIVVTDPNLLRYFMNSIIVTTCTIVLTFLTSAFSAYAFSQMRFFGKEIIYYVLLTSITLPASSIVLPLFLLVRTYHLMNSYLALIGPYTALNYAFSMLILRNFFKDIPRDIVDSSKIDGCSWWKIFWNIFIPLSKAPISVVVIMTFLQSWNEYLLAISFMKSTKMLMLTMAPSKYIASYSWDIPKLFAVIVVIATPTILLFVALQGQFIRGLTAGALKE